MEISAILAFIFLLPGYLSYIVVRQFTVGFGRNTGTFDKTLISLLFDIPIFLLTLFIFNWDSFIRFFNLKKYGYSGLHTINQFYYTFNEHLDLLILLATISMISSVLIGFLWILLLKIPSWGNEINYIVNKRVFNDVVSKNKITYYHNMWKSEFVKTAKTLPVKIYNLDNDGLITYGFLEEVSLSLDSDVEFKVYDQELFVDLVEEKVIKEVEFIYINQTKGFKIIVYSMSKIEEIVSKLK